MKKRFILLSSLTLLLFAGAGCSLFADSHEEEQPNQEVKTEEMAESPAESTEKEITNAVTSAPKEEESRQEKSVVSPPVKQVKECGSDTDCFHAAAQTCTDATYQFEDDGLIFSSHISDKGTSTCTFAQSLLSINTKDNPELEIFLSPGYPKIVGEGFVCQIPKAALATDPKGVTFNSYFDDADTKCEGNLFKNIEEAVDRAIKEFNAEFDKKEDTYVIPEGETVSVTGIGDVSYTMIDDQNFLLNFSNQKEQQVHIGEVITFDGGATLEITYATLIEETDHTITIEVHR